MKQLMILKMLTAYIWLLQKKTGYGIYDVEVDRFGKIFVSTAASSDTLMIASDAALDCLIKMLEERWCEEGMSMEAQYSFIHAMRKDD